MFITGFATSSASITPPPASNKVSNPFSKIIPSAIVLTAQSENVAMAYALIILFIKLSINHSLATAPVFI